MSAAKMLIEQVANSGGEVWLEGDGVKARMPKKFIADLAPRLREHKAEIISLLARQRARRSANVRANLTVWHFLIDGKGVTAIDREQLSQEEMQRYLNQKFGCNRVEKLTSG